MPSERHVKGIRNVHGLDAKQRRDLGAGMVNAQVFNNALRIVSLCVRYDDLRMPWPLSHASTNSSRPRSVVSCGPYKQLYRPAPTTRFHTLAERRR